MKNLYDAMPNGCGAMPNGYLESIQKGRDAVRYFQRDDVVRSMVARGTNLSAAERD